MNILAVGVQVRLAACHAARALLQNCDPDLKQELLPMLLPQLCFNRWHESDGVRLYSQETWQQVMQGQGPSWLARCLPQVSCNSETALACWSNSPVVM